MGDIARHPSALTSTVKATDATFEASRRYAIPLASGEKRTVMILDKAGSGVRVELL